MGETIVEKIMAKAAGKESVSPGEYLKFGIKDTFIQVGSDVGPRTIEAFAEARLGQTMGSDKGYYRPGTLRFIFPSQG